MNRVILIKYGELTTKKDNRKMFVNVLHKNIVNKLRGIDVFIYKDLSRMYIEFDEKDLDLILSKINTLNWKRLITSFSFYFKSLKISFW